MDTNITKDVLPIPVSPSNIIGNSDSILSIINAILKKLSSVKDISYRFFYIFESISESSNFSAF